MNEPPVSVMEVKVGTRSAKYWRNWDENDHTGKTVVGQHSQFELEDVGRNGIKRGGSNVTQVLFDLDSSAFVGVQLRT